ncbi:TnsD family Tn7-like transposition protein [Nitrospira moscoviensis]|uniref:Putative Tn7-like transposition protein D n=1 Tax=Nitrospira moscoviensis TaxID=42253 RepID=A0A0K2GI57_NITMO|nr:putative Tn7-like transposition protein D [Nitrospira moscoviensis]
MVKAMLACYAKPHPDELFYSVVARLRERLRFLSITAFLHAVGGRGDALASIDLPSYLDHFVSMLPARASLTTDDIIAKHTLLPFYVPFLSSGRVGEIKRRMRGGSRKGIQLVLGYKHANVPKSHWLRYCPRCVAEDRERWGECYWHRIHQVPGVEVCPDHAVWIQDSDAPARDLRPCHEFRSAERTVTQCVARSLMPDDCGATAILAFAQNAAWLLNASSVSPDPDALRRRYLALLAERGLATHTNRVYAHHLRQAFLRHYPQEVLGRLEGEQGGLRSGDGVLALVRRVRSSYSPIHHLLMMQFLRQTAESFFAIPNHPEHFGAGPWPCLNPAARHYQQAVITACALAMRADGRPVGTFCCACGFVYARTGPDWSPMMQFHVGRVLIYGRVWDQKLRECWMDSGLSVEAIADKMGVSPPTLRAQLRRIGLPLRRVVSSPRQASRSAGKLQKVTRVFSRSFLCEQREKWLGLSREKARLPERLRQFRSLTSWLRRYDRAWFRQYGNRRIKAFVGHSVRRTVDWEKRDQEFAELIRTTAERIRVLPGQPPRFSRMYLIRQTGQLRMIAPYLRRLPRTADILGSLTEP